METDEYGIEMGPAQRVWGQSLDVIIIDVALIDNSVV